METNHNCPSLLKISIFYINFLYNIAIWISYYYNISITQAIAGPPPTQREAAPYFMCRFNPS